MRHFAQTDADRQRRITESFSKAVEQLAHNDIEVRLGGIYTLERISKESPDDYWTVMEILTAFVRERTRAEAERLEKPLEQRKAERARRLWEEAGKPAGHDEPGLDDAHLERADLTEAHLQGANLNRAHLERADLTEAHLEGADLIRAHLERADLFGAHLEGAAGLIRAHLEGAKLGGRISKAPTSARPTG